MEQGNSARPLALKSKLEPKPGLAQANVPVRADQEGYEGIAFKLYAATFLVLFSAISYGNALSLGIVLEPNFILDISLYRIEDFYFNLCLYFVLGQITGASLASFMCQRFGPKLSLLASSLSLLLSWLLILGQIHLVNTMLCIRYFNGFSASIIAISCLVYLFDISPVTGRGGILASFTTASIFGYYFPSLLCFNDPYYHVLIALGINLIGILVLAILPESPIWLMGNSNDPRDLFLAEKALRFLRPSNNLCATLLEINRLVGEQDQYLSITMDHPFFVKPLRVDILLMALHECTFLNLYYMLGRPFPLLFGYFAPDSSLRKGQQVPMSEQTMVPMAIAQMITALVIVSVLIKYVTRRTILIVSASMLVVVNFAQAIVLTGYKDQPYSEDLALELAYLMPIGGIICTIIQPVVLLSIVEMPIHEYRAYTCTCAWIVQWIITGGVLCLLYYLPTVGYLVYYLSSVALVVIIVLLYLYLPSTEDRTTSQIIRKLL